ncbi:MAG: 4-hydroxy-3-methylbut-2-enyl diphosphate reductase [Vampirovibrio sp.]
MSATKSILAPKGETASGKSIYMAQHAGFCHGVQKAVDKTVETHQHYEERPTYVLGQLIHNQQEIQRLEALGIRTVQELQEIPDGAVCVIRTHGASPELVKMAEARGIEVSDATCPDVRLVQNKAVELTEEGYTVVIVGKANHPEVIGITAYAREVTGAKVVAIAHPKDIQDTLKDLPRRRIGVVSQTTQMEDIFFDMVKHLSRVAKELKVHNTICPATFFRQHAVAELAQQVEVMVVIGGKNSSNTTHLAQLCTELGTPAFHIETPEELSDPSPLKVALTQATRIGMTAGASTPDWIIQNVYEHLKANF